MVGIRFGGSRDEISTLMQRLGIITPPLSYDVYYVDFGSDEGHCFNVFVDDHFEVCQLAVCYQVTAWPQVPPPQMMRIKNHGERPN